MGDYLNKKYCWCFGVVAVEINWVVEFDDLSSFFFDMPLILNVQARKGGNEYDCVSLALAMFVLLFVTETN